MIVSDARIHMAFRILRRNYGCPGADGISLKEIKRNYTLYKAQILTAFRSGAYAPAPPRGCTFVDAHKRVRQIYVYNVCDRWFQQCLRLAITPDILTKIQPYVYSYIKGRNNTQAAAHVLRNRSAYILKLDIHDFFSSVHLDTLWDMLSSCGIDRTTVGLIIKTMPTNAIGLPPGNVLSPLLSNLYLTPVDEAFPQNYARFSDDLLFAINDSSSVNDIHARLALPLSTLHLHINKDKQKLFRGPTVDMLL